MKITSLVFIILVLMIAFRYTEVLIIDTRILIGVFIIWLACIYIDIHLKNKDRDTPRPVYITQ